ncbi:MAG: HAD family hydrolase [Chloroflexota bacterium]|nr:HAD family hydrolase [Chloroflexota bacterium]
MAKAVFLDRDGVINELVYHQEWGMVDSPFTVEQLHLFPWAAAAIRRLAEAGYKVVVCSNQPGMAKGHLSAETFERIKERMREGLAAGGASVDGEYYCLHHPQARVAELKRDCDCRKPRPGLLLRAAQELDIDLESSWMVGDGLSDVKAGRDAGCHTVLLGRMKCELCRLMESEGARPDAIAQDVMEAAQIILQWEEGDGDLH